MVILDLLAKGCMLLFSFGFQRHCLNHVASFTVNLLLTQTLLHRAIVFNDVFVFDLLLRLFFTYGLFLDEVCKLLRPLAGFWRVTEL